MRIAVSAGGRTPDSKVEDRFGRCFYFVLVDEEGNHLETLTNTSLDSPQGAGIAAAQLLINTKVDAILTGRVGPKALKPLQTAGIKIYTGVSGTVEQSVGLFQKGKLKEIEKAGDTVPGRRRAARGGI